MNFKDLYSLILDFYVVEKIMIVIFILIEEYVVFCVD